MPCAFCGPEANVIRKSFLADGADELSHLFVRNAFVGCAVPDVKRRVHERLRMFFEAQAFKWRHQGFDFLIINRRQAFHPAGLQCPMGQTDRIRTAHQTGCRMDPRVLRQGDASRDASHRKTRDRNIVSFCQPRFDIDPTRSGSSLMFCRTTDQNSAAGSPA